MKQLALVLTILSFLTMQSCKLGDFVPASSTSPGAVTEESVDVQVAAKTLDVPGTSIYDLSSEPNIATATIQQNNQNFVVNSDQLVVLNVAPSPGLSTDFVIQTSTKKMTLHVEVAIAEQTSALPAVWGTNPGGNVLLTGSSSVTSSPVLATSTALQFKQIAPGNAHACGLVSDGTAYCWGEGDYGRLGTNSTTDTVTPIAVVTSIKFKSIAVSAVAWGGDRAHSCGIDLVGKVYCWGKNTYGQLGNGSVTHSLVPVAVNSNERFTALALSGNSSCGLTQSKTVFCWGRNEHGQLGQGNILTSNTPVLVSGNYSQIAVGNDEVCAIHATNQHLYCWGHKDHGATTYISNFSTSTVDDAMTDILVPTLFDASRTYKSIAGGASSFCVIDSVNDGYCWGHEMYGRLGIANLKEFYGLYYAPMKIVGSTKWKAISPGKTNAIGIDMNDDVWVWGQNDNNELGVGFATNSPTLPEEGGFGMYSPYRINDSSKYAAVFAGENYGFGIRK